MQPWRPDSLPRCLPSQGFSQTQGHIIRGSPCREGWDIWFCPRMIVPSMSSAPRVMLPSVRMAGSTRLPSGMRATRLNRKIAASRERKNSRAPAKKKFPAAPRLHVPAGDKRMWQALQLQAACCSRGCSMGRRSWRIRARCNALWVVLVHEWFLTKLEPSLTCRGICIL